MAGWGGQGWSCTAKARPGEPGAMGVNAGSVRVGKLEGTSLCSKELDFLQREVGPLHLWSYLCLGQSLPTLDFSIYVVPLDSLRVGAGHAKRPCDLGPHGTSGPGDGD